MKAEISLVVILFCFVELASAQKPPREYAKSKCVKRIKNETQLESCKSCVEDFALPEFPTRDEVKGMIKSCIPKKEPKEWVKGKCEDSTESLEEIEQCYLCVDSYDLPKNVTRNDVRAMKKSCLPKPSLKFKAKRKCVKKLREKAEIENCQQCIEAYNLPESASCEEVHEMKRICVMERSGRELWSEPIMFDEEEEEFI